MRRQCLPAAIALHKAKEAWWSLQKQVELGKAFLGMLFIRKTKIITENNNKIFQINFALRNCPFPPSQKKKKILRKII